MTEQQLRKQMYQEIQASNKDLTTDYLDSLSINAVLAYTHPLYREKWSWKVIELFKEVSDS